MKNLTNNRYARLAQLPIVLLALALGVSNASVGHADELSTMTITAKRPVTTDNSTTYRDEVQARARVVVWKTRFNAMSDLGLKLNSQHPNNVQLAGTFQSDSG